MTKDLLAAKRYAKALFDISRDLHKDEEVEAELESLSAGLKKDPSIERFLGHPGLKLDQKREFLLRIYQERNHDVYNVLLNFFLLLFEKNRFYLIHDIAVEFKRVADEAQGQGVAEIRTVEPLKPEALKAITQRLEKMAGYKITVKSILDPSLIGGVVVRVKNKVLDDSIATKIRNIRKELTSVHSI